MATPQLVPSLVLASSSPRRRDLLGQIGVVPARVQSPDIDETPHKAEQPRLYAERMAVEKARAVPRTDAEIVLAGDTTVAAGRRILGQAQSPEDVARFLALLSGRRHRVISAIALIDTAGKLRSRVVTSQVGFKRLSPQEIAAYAENGEGIGKAAGYAIQGQAAGLIDWIQGSYTGVVGLPLFETRALLKAAGMPIA
ncbi:nucleoside triphosphate pyrophosphatase [Parerythrobacter aurantius]|uniref:Maf family protein n=1 Tax=Parerythrobacter aurantius TaxID=3127706 RepID=UPI00324866A6